MRLVLRLKITLLEIGNLRVLTPLVNNPLGVLENFPPHVRLHEHDQQDS